MRITATELQAFQSAVKCRLGLWFDQHRHSFLKQVLQERCEILGYEQLSKYLENLSRPGGADEWRVLASRLTVTETYFFRGHEHFQALLAELLAKRTLSPRQGPPLRLLSAGCSSGEEAYTLAITLQEEAPWLEDVEIVAVDINREMLAKARAGRFSAWSLRETPPEIQRRYFRCDRGDYVLDAAIHRRVVFQERNLSHPADLPWPADYFDAIFCRNMLMYFPAEIAQGLIARFAESLAPGGWVFLGHAETMRGLSQAFHLRRRHGAFYYCLKAEPSARDGHETGAVYAPTAATPAVLSLSSTWFDEIGRATAKIAVLTEAPNLAATRRHPVVPDISRQQPAAHGNLMERVLDLHRQERFSEALTHLEGQPRDGTDPDLQILRAVLLLNCGKPEEAERLCRPLLNRDEFNAGARLVTALCREHDGDLGIAEEHHRAAAYLDPLFAMPRFHLGMICKRQGRRAEAVSHFMEAQALLAREDPLRLLLFGGGFSRQALLKLCRDEIQRQEGTR